MRIHTKNQLLDLVGSIRELHTNLLNVDRGTSLSFLQDCQQAAIAIGEQVEADAPEDIEVVPLLERYCELVYEIFQKEVIVEDDINMLEVRMQWVYDSVLKINAKYRVVFLPYKVEMWDSLESIWKACSEDENCECHVVPIPYFEFDREAGKAELRYDIDRYPSYVSVIDYNDYPMSKMLPDVAYVHNPYDDKNLATSVHPYFYSKELKKYVKKLIYVPYYVNTSHISQGHQYLPIHACMDYMVIQSEYAKERCKELFYYDKLLPMGSPKFDKVINRCKQNVDIRREWKSILCGKHILMLNTTLNDILNWQDILLCKLQKVFEYIKNRDDVALIWRPHPLLETTIKSMRPDLLKSYEELVGYFIENKVGVFDDTPDVSDVVAIADGYIGSAVSSVINLFGVVGKPIFTFNNSIMELSETTSKYRLRMQDGVRYKDKIWFIAEHNGAITYIDLSDEKKVLHFAGINRNETKWRMPYLSIAECKGELYFSPFYASQATKAKLAEDITGQSHISEFVMLGGLGRQLDIRYLSTAVVDDKIVFLPINDNVIMIYDIESNQWKYETESLCKLWEGYDRKQNQDFCANYNVQLGSLWITTSYTNSVLKLNVSTCESEIYHIGDSARAYSGVVADDEGLWLADNKSGELVRWIYGSERVEIYLPPKGLKSYSYANRYTRIYKDMHDMGKYLVMIPAWSNSMVKFEKETGKMILIAEEFLKDYNKPSNGFHPKYMPASQMTVKIDEQHILLQRNVDDMLAIVDIIDDLYIVIEPKFSEEDYDKLLEGEDGFERCDCRDYFCQRESNIYTLDNFINNLVGGNYNYIKERQIKELSTMAANLDGTCGQKVHKYIMNELMREI